MTGAGRRGRSTAEARAEGPARPRKGRPALVMGLAAILFIFAITFGPAILMMVFG